MEFKKFKSELEASKYVAKIVIDKIKANSGIKLGLATGSTPVCLYAELAHDYKTNHTNWSQVKTFNLDEYDGVDYASDISYHKFMKDELFNHVNIDTNNTFFPEKECNFDKFIKEEGGIDLQILGIGVNGHIGFNEPGSTENSQTRIVDLTPITVEVNGNKYFDGELDKVPKKAISMGLETIMQSKQIILLAFGKCKEDAIKKLSDAKTFDINFPASILIKHPNVTIIYDEEINI